MQYNWPFLTQVDTQSHKNEEMSGRMTQRKKDRERIYAQVFDSKPYIFSILLHSLSIPTEIPMIQTIFLSLLLSFTVRCPRKVGWVHWVQLLPSALSLTDCNLTFGSVLGCTVSL